MILINSRFKTLALYASRVPLIDYFKPSVYAAFLEKKQIPWCMVREFRKTIWIDLSKSEDEILMGFKSNTRNEVRKAMRECITIELVKEVECFVEFYNRFAREKGLEVISNRDILKYPNVLICQSLLNGKSLCMHANVIDEDNKIVRLLYSASVRFDTGIDRKVVGLSNRFLHYAEFLKFKQLGYVIYDFGGINEDENNKEQYNITIFKKGFGGEIREEIHLKSVLVYLLLKLSILFSYRNKH